MNVISVVGGKDASVYDKVVIMLHGGGGSGMNWVDYQYVAGQFGSLAGFKYVFPTSPLDGHVWYKSFKNGCGLDDDCAYDLPSIKETSSAVGELIKQEMGAPQISNKGSKVFLAGFSEGAQLTGYMQLAKLDFALGGVIVMDG